MNILILFSNRIIKFFANLSKMSCYGFHYVFPKKRFLIPSRSPAWLPQKSNSKIPRIIWQTNYTNKVTLPVYLNYLFNRLMSPGFEHRFVSTEERAAFVKEHYSEDLFRSFSRLQIGASQADFWRVLVLQKYGGIYLDIDAHFVWPAGYIVSPHFEELFVISTKGNITNYFISSKADNPKLQSIIDRIHDNIAHQDIKNVYELTGPGVFNKVLDPKTLTTKSYRQVCSQGNFSNEYFQYIDKPQGKWTKEQRTTAIVRDPS